MTDLPVTKADDDLVERLREESLQLARRSFDSVDAGISANLCDRAIDEITRLRSQLAAAEAERDALRRDLLKSVEKWQAAEAQLQAMRKALEEIIEAGDFYGDEAKHIAREALRSLTEGAGK